MSIDINLEDIVWLNEGPVLELDSGFIYKMKSLKNKEFFIMAQKHLVYTSVLKKISTKTAKSNASKQVKQELIKKLSWWTEVRNWLQVAYLFVFGDKV